MTAWGLLGGGVVAALVYLVFEVRLAGVARSVLKTVPVAAFAVAAFLAAAPPWLTAGLFLSALGDLALSRQARAAFLYGLSAFALAQLCYVLLFLGVSGATLWQAFATHPLPAVGLLALVLSTEVWLAPHAGRLRWPVRVYVALIGAMFLAALTLPVALWRATLGAGLFILSDLILALRDFRLSPDHPLARPAGAVLWIAYITGQALILSAFLG